MERKIKTIVSIEGMHCEHCSKKVHDALINLGNIKKVKVDLQKKTATIMSAFGLDKKQIKDAIENLDYKVLNIEEK